MELGVDKFCIENLPSLKNHLSYALDDRRVGRSMFLSYESLLQDPAASLTAALNFLGLTVSPESVIDAIDVNRFDRLQQRELASLDRPFPFFREGKAGGGKRRLDSDTLERITAAAGPLYEAARQREPDGITSPAGASSPSARLLA